MSAAPPHDGAAPRQRRARLQLRRTPALGAHAPHQQVAERLAPDERDADGGLLLIASARGGGAEEVDAHDPEGPPQRVVGHPNVLEAVARHRVLAPVEQSLGHVEVVVGGGEVERPAAEHRSDRREEGDEDRDAHHERDERQQRGGPVDVQAREHRGGHDRQDGGRDGAAARHPGRDELVGRQRQQRGAGRCAEGLVPLRALVAGTGRPSRPHAALLGEEVLAKRLGGGDVERSQADGGGAGVAGRLDVDGHEAEQPRGQLLAQLDLLDPAERHRPVPPLQHALIEGDGGVGHRVGAEPPAHRPLQRDDEADHEPGDVEGLARPPASSRAG